MYSKEDIYNLALGALLLQRQVTNAETDKSNEVKVLNSHYNAAFFSCLEDMDLDSTSTQANLELIEQRPNNLWSFSYKYPNDCALLRRLQSCVATDGPTTRLDLRVAIKAGKKVIFTNEADAIAEYVSKTVPLSSLSASAGIAVAMKLAQLSSPLITGKGAKTLIEQIQNRYIVAKTEAQETDRKENFVFVDPALESEFVAVRTE